MCAHASSPHKALNPGKRFHGVEQTGPSLHMIEPWDPLQNVFDVLDDADLASPTGGGVAANGDFTLIEVKAKDMDMGFESSKSSKGGGSGDARLNDPVKKLPSKHGTDNNVQTSQNFSVDLDKKIRALKRRRKKPNVLLQKFLAIVASDLNGREAAIIYRDNIDSRSSVQTERWKKWVWEGDKKIDSKTKDVDENRSTETRALSLTKGGFHACAVRSIRDSKRVVLSHDGKDSAVSSASFPLYHPKYAENTVFASVMIRFERKNKGDIIVGDKALPTTSIVSQGAESSLTPALNQTLQQVEIFVKNSRHLVYSAFHALQQRMPQVVGPSFDFTTVDGNILTSTEFLSNKSLSPSSISKSTPNEPAQTLDLAFDMVAVNDKKTSKKGSKDKKNTKKSSGLKLNFKKKKKYTKRPVADLSFSSPRIKNSSKFKEFQRPEDDGLIPNTIEGKAKQVLLEAFDAVNKEFEDANDWASSTWSKDLLSPNSYLSPYKDFYTAEERIKIDEEKRRIGSLPMPKLRYKKRLKGVDTGTYTTSFKGHDVKKKVQPKVGGEDSYLNVKECRGQFREYLNKAMRDTEYLEKKRALFKPKLTRKELVTDTKLQLRDHHKKANSQNKLVKIQNPQRPFHNEMRVLENKGLLAFINEALKSNKSALRNGYSIQRLLYPGKSNKWKKANHLQSRSIGAELGNIGRGRRRYGRKQTKSRKTDTLANYESYSNQSNVPFLDAIKLKKYGSPRPPEKTGSKRSKDFRGKHRRVKPEAAFDESGQGNENTFHKSITLDEYFLKTK